MPDVSINPTSLVTAGDIVNSSNPLPVSIVGASSLTAITETYTAPVITANVLTIDVSLGTVFNVANTANISTFTISNAVAGKATIFTLVLTANGSGFTQSWGASVVWAGGVAPTLTTTNAKRDILMFLTNDGGTTWFASVYGQAF